MYNVLSSLATCGRLGSSGATGVFVWQAASSTRRTLARRQQTESVVCQQWTAADASELVRFSTVLLVDSLVVTLVEFPTHLSFESETCRAGVFWETRG